MCFLRRNSSDGLTAPSALFTGAPPSSTSVVQQQPCIGNASPTRARSSSLSGPASTLTAVPCQPATSSLPRLHTQVAAQPGPVLPSQATLPTVAPPSAPMPPLVPAWPLGLPPAALPIGASFSATLPSPTPLRPLVVYSCAPEVATSLATQPVAVVSSSSPLAADSCASVVCAGEIIVPSQCTIAGLRTRLAEVRQHKHLFGSHVLNRNSTLAALPY